MRTVALGGAAASGLEWRQRHLDTIRGEKRHSNSSAFQLQKQKTMATEVNVLQIENIDTWTRWSNQCPVFFLSFANANWVPHFGLFRFLLVRLVLCLVHRNLTVITIYIEHRGSRSSRPITHSYCLSGRASPFFFFSGVSLGLGK